MMNNKNSIIKQKGGFIIKNKFIKNLFQMLSYAACELILIIPILSGGFYLEFKNKTINMIILLSILFLILIYFFIGFYWIFQVVVIDTNGITVYFFRKKIRYIQWNDIDKIEKTGIMRNPCYSFIIKNSKPIVMRNTLIENPVKQLNVDCRKSIKQAIMYYAPDNLKNSIS